VVLLGGCFTGKRPSFAEDEAVATGDDSIDAILTVLDQPISGDLTAVYTVLNKYGSSTITATVTRDSTRTSTTIGDVRFLTTPTGTQTCTVSTGECEQGLVDARVSNTAVLHTFFKESAATRLRRDAAMKVSPGEPYDATIADQAVMCVRVPMSGTSSAFCVLPNGLLASQDSPEVNISMTTYSATATEALFTPTGT
jgi:hypothetical protein